MFSPNLPRQVYSSLLSLDPPPYLSVNTHPSAPRSCMLLSDGTTCTCYQAYRLLQNILLLLPLIQSETYTDVQTDLLFFFFRFVWKIRANCWHMWDQLLSIKSILKKQHPHPEQHFFNSRLIVSSCQGFVLITGCHSELPAQGCTFCFLKHPLISPFFGQTHRVLAEHCSIVWLVHTAHTWGTDLFTSTHRRLLPHWF